MFNVSPNDPTKVAEVDPSKYADFEQFSGDEHRFSTLSRGNSDRLTRVAKRLSIALKTPYLTFALDLSNSV